VAASRVRLHPGAERDVEEGLAFYLGRSPIAAERFLSELDAVLERIREAPVRWPRYRHGTRRCVLGVFPYSIVYRVVSDEIHVYAIAHARRRPFYWKKRRS